MYEKILVPLDGSKLSECVIDQVRMMAKGCKIPKIVLLQVVEPMRPSATIYVGDEVAKDVQKKSVAAAHEYLSYAGGSLRTSCGGMETVVLEGNPSHEILEYAKSHGIDLIAMSTHGETGFVRWAVGSVTRNVMDAWAGPLLTIPPAGCRP